MKPSPFKKQQPKIITGTFDITPPGDFKQMEEEMILCPEHTDPEDMTFGQNQYSKKWLAGCVQCNSTDFNKIGKGKTKQEAIEDWNAKVRGKIPYITVEQAKNYLNKIRYGIGITGD